MGRPKKFGEQTSTVAIRLPNSWISAFAYMADVKNPVTDLMRDALKQYLKKAGKLT